MGRVAEVVALARASDLLVIADGKRGDVPVSAAAYAQALAGATATLAGEIAGLGVDAFTGNPLLGVDALEPLVATGAGVFVLVRTSNPGAADLQDRELASGERLWERIARLVEELGEVRSCGLSDVGAVHRGDRAGPIPRARELMPHAIFLLPGIGAQGGRIEELEAAFAPGTRRRSRVGLARDRLRLRGTRRRSGARGARGGGTSACNCLVTRRVILFCRSPRQ